MGRLARKLGKGFCMHIKFADCCVIGLGYIGLPTAAVLAAHGVRVYGIDVNSKVVDTINQGKIHIIEPDLDAIVHQTVRTGKLSAHKQPVAADAYIIAVPTPFHEDKSPDLSYIRAATASIAPVLRPGSLVVLESTSPVGTTEQLCKWLKELRPDLSFPMDDNNPDVCIAYCPERVLPGKVLHELIYNDRAIGGMTVACSNKAEALYKTFLKGNCYTTNARTAEMAKLTENAFRDVNIAFANELSLICSKNDINVWELIHLANKHPRVNILQPGPGVGGHCIAVDPWFIVAKNPDEARLIRTAREVNDAKPHRVVTQTLKVAKEFNLNKLAVLGLTYKPDIDDMRESPALDICEELAAQFDGQIFVVEPHIVELPVQLKTKNCALHSVETALAECDGLLILVDHKVFRAANRELFHNKVIIDAKGVFQPGFHYQLLLL